MITRKHIALSVLFVLCLFLAMFSAIAREGRIVRETIHSPSLEGNLLGDSPDRPVTIYLPPSYDVESDRRYPVVYLLHGYSMRNTDWIGGGTYGGLFSILPGLNRFMNANSGHHMIIVMPDAYNKYRGSWYANSSVTGNWEDFITQELVQYVDATYRTLPQAASRGMAGYSMGGAGAWRCAILHPDVYGALYALSGGGPLDKTAWVQDMNAWRATLMLKNANQFDTASFWVQVNISAAAAFSPNPSKPPFFADFPFELVDGQVRKVESVYQKWVEGFDVVALIRTHQENLRRLNGIRFGFGRAESGLAAGKAVHDALTELGIPHVFEEYAGDHTDNINGRVETKVLPFFSDVLAHEMKPVGTAVQPHDKLATMWGAVKRGDVLSKAQKVHITFLL